MKNPALLSAARRAVPPWLAPWRRVPISCCWTSPPIIWICPLLNGWNANLKAMRAALVLISHDRRLEILSRAGVWKDHVVTRRLNWGFAGFENWRDMLMEQEEVERHKPAKSRKSWTGWRMAAAAQAQPGAARAPGGLRQSRREQLKPMGSVKLEAAVAETSGTKAIDGSIAKSFGDKT